MEYQINQNIKFNKDKNIGTVLYIVEGGSREINLLGYIFSKILNYNEVIGIDRFGNKKIQYISKTNKNSKVFIINSKESNIKSITDTEFRDTQVKLLKTYDEDFNYEDIPIYYIFDCDREEDKEKIPELIKLYINSREANEENKYDSIGGMLLLNYPAIETFVISNFEKDMTEFNNRFEFDKHSLKEYINNKKYSNNKMNVKTLMNAFNELIKSLIKINININNINLEDISQFNKEIFEYEKSMKNRYMLSLLLISFIDLGIIQIN